MMSNAQYRVAIASTDNINVDQHFGRAESFLIVDVNEDGTYEEIEQRFVTPVCMGGHHNQENLQKGARALEDCNFVLAARIGEGATAELADLNIASFEMHGTVEYAIGKLHGYLELLKEFNSIGAT